MDNQPPVVKNGGGAVLEGGNVTLTKDMLDATDQDTDHKNLMFVLMEVPKHGR